MKHGRVGESGSMVVAQQSKGFKKEISDFNDNQIPTQL